MERGLTFRALRPLARVFPPPSVYGRELAMEEIGKLCGVSKMAVSKRLKKLHEKLGNSVT